MQRFAAGGICVQAGYGPAPGEVGLEFRGRGLPDSDLFRLYLCGLAGYSCLSVQGRPKSSRWVTLEREELTVDVYIDRLHGSVAGTAAALRAISDERLDPWDNRIGGQP